MVKREVKRKIKRTVLLIGIFVGATVLIVLSAIGVKTFYPLLSLSNATSQNKIIPPIVAEGNITELKSKLFSKNISFESLSESSTSGVIIGKIESGATVYFSKNQDVDWQVQSLVLILSRKTADNKKPKVIDLRTSRPIVKF